MSSDTDFIANGPTAAGYQTNGANITIGVDVHGNSIGVRGTCMGAAGDGVQGRGSGNFSGVAGFGGTDAGTGVFGLGGGQSGVLVSARGPGVRGIGGGYTGAVTGPPGPVGVWGQGGPPSANVETGSPGVVGVAFNTPGINADGVQGFGNAAFSGVAGFGDNKGGNGTGVFGLGGAPSGPGVRGIGFGVPPTNTTAPVGNAVGVLGQGGTGNSDGVYGIGSGTGAGIHGIGRAGPSGAGHAGLFDGDVLVNGNLTVTGAKHAIVPFPDGSHRRLYCMESPECWFEDFGFGELVAGEATVELDPGFAAVVNTNVYHVFITEYDDHRGLYVTKRSSTGFEVHAKDGMATGSFGYRILAKRKDIVAKRFDVVTTQEENLQAAE